ncbi:hypothetical protein [Nonomuraea cavernae]|uniref:hypothetical protein n=1 Tax=Nonomuraea cavernae TaxID=2045107 RepID=UPI00340DF5CB
MSIHLIVEVMDHAPDLTHREHKVLIVFAEKANDITRQAWPGIDSPEFVRRTRIKSRSERYQVINELIAKGVLRRVSGGHNGRRAVFEIPPLAPQATTGQDGQGPGDQDPSAGKPPGKPDPTAAAKDPENLAEGAGKTSRSVRGSWTPSPQSPQEPSSSGRVPARSAPVVRPAQVVMNELGVDAGEAAQIAAAVQAEHRPRDLAGYLTKLARTGDLADWQDRVREQAARQQARAAAGDHRTAPPCPHGEPGGDQFHPRTGRPWCPLCRAGAPADIDAAMLSGSRTGGS